MSGAVDPGAVPVARFGTEGMRCECGGWGKLTDVMEVDESWSLVTWVIGHRPGCPGEAQPERAWLLSVDAHVAGDRTLPWVEPEEARRFLWPPGRCAAWVLSAGRRCRNPAGPDGLCPAHRRRS
jgi:hypothetical protein